MNRSAYDHDVTDAELVQRAQRGVAAAFGELVARYQDRVYNTCFRMCHNHTDALDLTQSTFLRALEALPAFRRDANFFTWLFRIAMNLTLSARRSRTRHPTASLPGVNAEDRAAPGPPADPATTNVSAGVEQEERRAAVARALAALDDEFRAAVVLKDIEDLDYATIADILSVPIGTVKSRIHRGRMMLRDLLRSENVTREHA